MAYPKPRSAYGNDDARTFFISGRLCRLGISYASAQEFDEQVAVMKARRLIENQANTILHAAHPLGKYTGYTFVDYQKVETGHELTYAFNWTDNKLMKAKEFVTKLGFSFNFDADQDIERVVVQVKEDSGTHEAFSGGILVNKLLKGYIKSKLKALELEKDDIYKTVDQWEAKALLETWLKYAARKDPR